MHLRLSDDRPWPLERPRIMGILNVTPDSFSDGGAHNDPAAAVAHAQAMADAGADVIDVGGESTRPGSQRVGADDQIRRVVPVIRELR
ncbi:MAG: dihydropteroate synthase, partial [Phycisphaeraceae bacterium]|nr:dihydropteroate synthase [Phycisphaeraceae bacterium]